MGRITNCVFQLLSLCLVNSHLTMASKYDAVGFAKTTQSFALDLYAHITESKKENVIVSPLSIEMAVALAGMGATGETEREISTGLKLGSSTLRDESNNFAALMQSIQNEPTVKIANKIYVMDGFTVKPTFYKIATSSFFSETQNLNFGNSVESAKSINTWVEDKTNNKIKDLIKSDDLDSLTRMVLVNAIYFKGLWKNKFNSDLTTKQPFHLSKSESKEVDMMKTKAHFAYGEFADLNAKAIEMPYENSNISMFIILPNEIDGLNELQSKIRSIDIANMRSRMHKEEVDVMLPKFKVEFEIQLKDVLTKMGMGTMFDQNKANFNELLDSPEQLYVSKVIHKAFIEVNEEGTEAAAATGIFFTLTSAIINPREPKQFIVNRPFLYALKSPEHTVFVGKWSH